ncbi:MAG: tetratricopeptide repeat protein [Chloroflexi bacterium]|nr:MAG: tetratricopeptide repeat protein [Chloroflexota bacterium]
MQRIELHPLVQQFARELLARMSGTNVSGIRIAQQFVRKLLPRQPAPGADDLHGALVEHYSRWIEGKDENVLRADDLNLVSALEWAKDHQPQSNLTMAGLTFHLREYWQQRLQLEQATRWLPLGIDAMSHLDGPWPQRQADTTHALAAMYYGGGRMPEARGYYLQSLERFRKVGDRKGEGLALHSLGILAMHTSDPTGAENYLTQSLEVRRQIGDRQGVGQALNSLGLLFLDIDPPAAKPYLTESLEIRRELGEERNVALTLRSLGILSKGIGDLEAARQYYTDSLIVFRKIVFRRDEAITLQYLGVLLRNSDPASAREYYNDSLDILDETDDWRNKIASLYGLGFVHLNLNELEAAERYFNESLQYCKRGADQRSEGIALRGLGTLAEMQGDVDRAEICYREGLALAKKVISIENIARICELLGTLLLKYRDAAGKAEGCQMLAEAVTTYKQMSRPEDAERVEQEASRLGCSNENVSS